MILHILTTLALFAKLGDSLTITPLSSLTVTVGGGGSFTCENPEQGGEQPQWEDQNQNIINPGSSNRVYATAYTDPITNTRRAILFLQNLLKEDAGAYSCVVQGQQTQSRTINVFDPIVLTKESEELNQRLIFNTTSTLYCTATPREGLVYIWSKDSESVADRTKYSYTIDGQLTVYNVILRDEGRYTCIVQYPNFHVSAILEIDVIVQIPPQWDQPPRNREVVVDTDVTLQCLATGRPEPAVTWLDRTTATQRNITHTPGVYELSEMGALLRIVDIQMPASGNIYNIECMVSNDPTGARFSTAISTSIILTVLVQPILTSPVTQEVGETESRMVNFECANQQQGAVAELSFRRDGLDRMDELFIGVQPDDERITVTRNAATGSLTLTITNVQREHEGIWTCYAESAAGNVYTDHILNVRYIPVIDQSKTPDRLVSWQGNPTNLTCSFFGFPTPTITWSKNTQRLNATDQIKFISGTPAGTSVVQINPKLEDFAAYFCNGSNREGWLRYRQELVKASTPSQPLGLEIRSVTSSTVTIRFFPPEDDGELQILGYLVSYWIKGNTLSEDRLYDNPFLEQDLCRDVLPPANSDTARECFNYCESPSEICCPFSTRSLCVDRPTTQDFTEIRLTGLSAQSLYIVRVAARNQFGTGSFTENRTANTLTFDIPDPPEIISRSVSDYGDRYDLRWEPPIDDGGLDIIRYIVRFAQVEDRSAESLGPRYVEESADDDDRRREIFNLNPGKHYYLELRAVNTLGESLPAKINFETLGTFVYFTTPQARPNNKGFLGLYNKNANVVVAITIVVVFVVFLVVVDTCCYCVNSCGVMMFICVQCCGKTAPAKKEEIDMAEPELGSLKDWCSEA